MDKQKIKTTGCCEPFNPEPWQEKIITWKDKIFVKDHITSFLHIPLNMGGKVTKNMELIEKAKAKAPQQLMLTDELSPWGADIYIDVSFHCVHLSLDCRHCRYGFLGVNAPLDTLLQKEGRLFCAQSVNG